VNNFEVLKAAELGKSGNLFERLLGPLVRGLAIERDDGGEDGRKLRRGVGFAKFLARFSLSSAVEKLLPVNAG
jgi:hypothetical protein